MEKCKSIARKVLGNKSEQPNRVARLDECKSRAQVIFGESEQPKRVARLGKCKSLARKAFAGVRSCLKRGS